MKREALDTARRRLLRDLDVVGGVVLVVVCCLLFFGSCLRPVHAEGYPRVACYGSFQGGGAPIVKSDGTLDTAFAAAFARYPEVTVDINAATARPDMVALLRWLRPGIRIYGYQLIVHWYLPKTFVPNSSDRSFNAKWHSTLRAYNGWLPNGIENYEIDLTNRPMTDSLANLLAKACASLRLDGAFLDCCSPVIAWTGVSTVAQDSAATRNIVRFVSTLRDVNGPGFIVQANGTGAEFVGAAGTFREGFPGTLALPEAVRRWAADSTRTDDWLQAGSGATQSNVRDERFLLGTACVRGTKGSFGDDRRIPSRYHTWWFDEYSVRPAPYYDADLNGHHVGWLREWVGPPVQVAPGAWRADFPGGLVLLNETWSPFKFDLVVSNRFKRIRGKVDPVTNNGNEDRFQTVQPRDAVFMVRKPMTPRRAN